MESKGRELFIVDNSVKGWTGLRYLEEWTGIAKAFDIATGFFEIGALLALDSKWQALEKIRILMGSETTHRSRRILLETIRSRAAEELDRSIEDQKETQQRKLVTVMFMDIVDSTTITQHLDPEDTLSIMDTALQRLASPVYAYGGRVTRFEAESGNDYLGTILEIDEGARVLGELGIGTNPGIDRFTKNMLFDEKMGGTIHLALGAGFAEAGGKNTSKIHIDMLVDMSDGIIEADGKRIYENGRFLVSSTNK